MLIALIFGLVIGFLMDFIGQNSTIYTDFARNEIVTWYRLPGTGFLRLIQMMAIPVVFLSIIHVVIEGKGQQLKRLTGKTFTLLLGTTAVASLLGILVVHLFGLTKSGFAAELTAAKAESISAYAEKSIPGIFLDLVPSNIFQAFSTNSAVISAVIIAALFAIAIRFLLVKMPIQIQPIITGLNALKTLIHTVMINIIKFMPYAIMPLVATTIIQHGIKVILGLLGFVLALYVAVILMMFVYLIMLLFVGLSPWAFFKKAFPTLLFAFSSRSSVGTLPYTLETLQDKLGVSEESANFVATLGTSIGMNGCAGVFPAMLAVIVASAVGAPMDLTFYVTVVLVITISSIGIAGVPGTATIAATVNLNGLGYGGAMSSIGAVFGIDPIIDMGRTMLNVAGAMICAIYVDRWEGRLNRARFQQLKLENKALNQADQTKTA